MAVALRSSIGKSLNEGLRRSISAKASGVVLVDKFIITQNSDQLITQSGDSLIGAVAS